MANDKLMTYDQGTSMINSLGTIATNITNINKNIELGSNKITSMAEYTEPVNTSAINTNDSLNSAIGKLERKADNIQQEIGNVETALDNINDILEASL